MQSDVLFHTLATAYCPMQSYVVLCNLMQCSVVLYSPMCRFKVLLLHRCKQGVAQKLSEVNHRFCMVLFVIVYCSNDQFSFVVFPFHHSKNCQLLKNTGCCPKSSQRHNTWCWSQFMKSNQRKTFCCENPKRLYENTSFDISKKDH